MTSINICDIPTVTALGTSDSLSRRRILIFIVGNIAKNTAVDLASFVPNLTDIEGALFFTRNNAIATTALTWSTTTLTMTSEGATARDVECCVMGRYV